MTRAWLTATCSILLAMCGGSGEETTAPTGTSFGRENPMLVIDAARDGSWVVACQPDAPTRMEDLGGDPNVLFAGWTLRFMHRRAPRAR